jgi:hypothetical protein
MNIGGVFGALTPVFFVLALGYLAGKRNAFDADQSAGLEQSSSRLKDDDHSGGSVAMNSTNSRSVGAAQLGAGIPISNCRHTP